MKVKFRVNLGSRDSVRCGLDHKNCQADSVVNVSDEAGKWLTERGIAEALSKESPEQKPVVAVAKAPEVAGVKTDNKGPEKKN